MSENDHNLVPKKRHSKRFLRPSQKYEIWLQVVRQEVTMSEAVSREWVDRSTIVRIRTVAKEGALAASKPGLADRQHPYELEETRAEIARLPATFAGAQTSTRST